MTVTDDEVQKARNLLYKLILIFADKSDYLCLSSSSIIAHYDGDEDYPFRAPKDVRIFLSKHKELIKPFIFDTYWGSHNYANGDQHRKNIDNIYKLGEQYKELLVIGNI